MGEGDQRVEVGGEEVRSVVEESGGSVEGFFYVTGGVERVYSREQW